MGKYAIQRFKQTILLDVSENDTVATTGNNYFNGLLRELIVKTPDLDSTNTMTFSILDEDDFVIYEGEAQAKDSTVISLLDANSVVPLSGNHKLKVTTSGAQSVDRSFDIVFYIERR